MYFKSQEELEDYFGGPDKIPSNVLAIVGEPTGDEPAEYVLYTVSNNQSMTGTMQEQGGYITDPADHEKIVQLQVDVTYLDENKADKTQLADYVSYSYLSEQDYASETYVADYVSQHAPIPDLSAYVTKTELNNASYATTTYVQDKIDAIPTVDLTGYATEAYVTNKIGDIINSAPEALDTLEELASALGDDPNFATTISTQLGQKANSSDVYTKAEIQAMGYISNIPSEYVTEDEISAMGYITISDVPSQVQSDWNVTNTSYPSYILNKPTVPKWIKDGSELVSVQQHGATAGANMAAAFNTGKAKNFYSFACGQNTEANGDSSFVAGNDTITYNTGECGVGQANKSTKTTTSFGDAGNTEFSVGIGSLGTTKNAIEIMQNGDLYAYGVGNYDGTNFSSAYTLAYVINDIQTNLGAAASVAEAILGE